MKHTRFIISILIAALAMAIPAFAQDYGSTNDPEPVVTEVPAIPDWTSIDTPEGYSIFAKAGYSMITFETQGRGSIVMWFSIADVDSCADVQAFRVTDSGALAESTQISKCTVETGRGGNIGIRVEIARTGLPGNVIVYKKLKSNTVTELQSGEA